MKEQIDLLINEFNEKKAVDILHVDIEDGKHPLADHIIVLSALNEIHLKSLLDTANRFYKNNKNTSFNEFELIGISGKPESNWVILDFGSLIVHIMAQDTRIQYKFDELFDQFITFTYH